jgi:hypothetical protein
VKLKNRHYCLRSTNSLILHGIRKNCLITRKCLLLYQFKKGRIKLTVVTILGYNVASHPSNVSTCFTDNMFPFGTNPERTFLTFNQPSNQTSSQPLPQCIPHIIKPTQFLLTQIQTTEIDFPPIQHPLNHNTQFQIQNPSTDKHYTCYQVRKSKIKPQTTLTNGR